MKLNQLSFIQRLFLSIASGAMVIPLSYLESFHIPDVFDVSIIDICIGIVFALFVMVPFQKRISIFKTLLMILTSITIYTSVSKLAVSHYHLFHLNLDYAMGIVTSGALGALLTGIAIQLIAPLKTYINTYFLLTLMGAITGYIFSLTIDSESIFINAVGFVLWQTIVFLVLYFTSRKGRFL
jgi:hypothetical protein